MARVIMIQGTMSNSGKSFITAGLCRVFCQDGYRTAPFKSQNMALNSYVTKDGLEIGRAQAMQAEAAGIEPTVDMNPILLKPTSQMGSQVIVNGEVRGNMTAMDYYKEKQRLLPAVMSAFRRLDSQYDVIVVEGAGSPAEINLRENDIVNMGLAQLLDAPVLLVGDIDRGGVFASLYGTVKLLEPEEQDRIKGFIINKFRGDAAILEPGLRMLEERTGIPVVGCIPMEHIDIDDEDSLSPRLEVKAEAADPGNCVNIAVLRLPHISNFTDFAAFGRIERVNLYYAGNVRELGKPDCILIPGTKNTLDDLLWLRENGMESAVLRCREMGMPIMGICGGFQMLGNLLSDPEGVEYSEGKGCEESSLAKKRAASGRCVRGIGLLDMETVFQKKKMRAQSIGEWLNRPQMFQDAPQTPVCGYEIHMGETKNGRTCSPMIALSDGRTDGLVSQDGLVCGTYLHGLFDTEGAAEAFTAWLAERKGLTPTHSSMDLHTYKEAQYDRLASLIRNSLDMGFVYEVMGFGH